MDKSENTRDVSRAATVVAQFEDCSPTLRLASPSRRKEVIQPHLPVRLPCYDFTLLTKRTFDVAPHYWLG